MRILLNILWIIFGGLISSALWVAAGILWCITIIGIPIGLQCFKLSSISLNPFGKEIVCDDNSAGLFSRAWNLRFRTIFWERFSA